MQFKVIQRWYFIAIVLLFISVTSAYERCTADTYCDTPYTCCYANTKCCSNSSPSSSSGPTGAIVGGVVGGVFFLAIVLTIIRFCVIKKGHSGRVIKPAGQTTAQAYPQHTVNYTPTSGQYQINSAVIAGQNGPYGNMPAFYQPNGQNFASNTAPPSYSDNQNSGDDVTVAIPKAPEGL